MSRKKLIPVLSAISISALIILIASYSNHTKQEINNQIIYQVNSNNFLNDNIHLNTQDTKVLTPLYSAETVNLDDSYFINITEIRNGKLTKKEIEQSLYHTYSFDAKLQLSKDGTNHNKEISSSVIVEKNNSDFVIKSTDDLKQDIMKEIMAIKNENSEDISKELSNISLIYQNEELDIQLNYPDYYTYTNNVNNEKKAIENTVSFYMDSDKTSNYILLSMYTDSSLNHNEITAELLKQNYSLIKDNFTTPQGIKFSVLTQNFTQDLKDVTEMVFIAQNDYKAIEQMIITVKIDSNMLSNKQSEIEEIIKSIK